MDNCEEIDTVEKVEDIISLTRDFSPQIHKNSEQDYDYLEEDCICLTLKNSNNDVIYVDFEGEFTLSYAGWHTHYSSYSDEYEILKADLLSIINNDKCSFVIECKDEWMGSILAEKDITKEDAVIKIKKLLHHQEFRKKLRKNGAVVHCCFWDTSLNRDIIFMPGEIR